MKHLPRSVRRAVNLRTGGALAAAALLAPALAACGSSGGSSSASSPGASGKGFPASVATKFGKVTVKQQPKRVVALGWGDAETALALGAQPVGASDWLAFGGEGVGPWAKGLYKHKPELIGTLQPNYEKIAALKPDLILDTKSSGDAERHDMLAKIAPTVDVPKGGDQYKTSWEQQTRMVAAALGEQAKGEKLIKGVDAKFAAAKKAHPEFAGKTATVGALSGAGYGAYVHGDSRIAFMEKLGFKNNPKVEAKAGASFSVSVSRENLNLLDANLVVMSPIGVPASKISNDSLFKQIPAVKAGHDVVLSDPDISQAFATNSVLSLPYAVDRTVPKFAAALGK